MTPKVSIIIPVYNTEAYLERALTSVLSQTYRDFEAICVNDGSTDNSLAILESYAQKDPRIKVVSQENQGLSMARNNGLKNARGEYIYFLDSDDALHPQMLEITISKITEHQADLLCFRFKKNTSLTIQPTPIPLNQIPFKTTQKPLAFTKKHKFKVTFNAWDKLFKRTLIGTSTFISGIYFEDYPFTYEILSKSPKTVLLKTALHYYTTNNQASIMHLKLTTRHFHDYLVGLRHVIDCYNKPNFEKEQAYLKRTLVPTILKTQLQGLQHANVAPDSELYQAFIAELKEIHARGWLTWRGHKLSRYLRYKKLLRQGR